MLRSLVGSEMCIRDREPWGSVCSGWAGTRSRTCGERTTW